MHAADGTGTAETTTTVATDAAAGIAVTGAGGSGTAKRRLYPASGPGGVFVDNYKSPVVDQQRLAFAGCTAAVSTVSHVVLEPMHRVDKWVAPLLTVRAEGWGRPGAAALLLAVARAYVGRAGPVT